jgi:hypothetical protein
MKFERRFLATRKTSLMGKSLTHLEKISRHPTLGKAVKTLSIQDDCEKVDPYNCDRVTDSSEIWPRDDKGYVIQNHLNVERLTHILLEHHLRPRVIKFRCYRIANRNLSKCSKAVREKHNFDDLFVGNDLLSGSFLQLADEIVQSAKLSIEAICIQESQIRGCNCPIDHFPERKKLGRVMGLHRPNCYDITLTLSHDAAEQGKGFSSLRSAEVKSDPLWLQHILYNAPRLENLNLDRVDFPSNMLLSADVSIAALKRLKINFSKMTAAQLQIIMAQSRQSLTDLELTHVTLKHSPSWRDFLFSISRQCTGLTKFLVHGLRNASGEYLEHTQDLSFEGFTAEMVSFEHRAGLRIDSLPTRPGHRPISNVEYHGPDANLVLARLAGYFLTCL